MRTWVVWLPLVAAACADDPTLVVTVQHPMGFTIASTAVTVYESSSLTCEQVEFGDLTTDQLDAVKVAEETTFPSAAPMGALTNLSRTDPKIIVARGFGSDGKLQAAGCVEVDAVSGQDHVTITTEVAVTASITVADPTGGDLYGVEVLTTDSSGMPIDGRPVSWRTYGPSGTVGAVMTGLAMVSDGVWQPVSPSCTASGTALIHPVPPNLIGGYAVQVRVAWAIDPVPLYSALTKLDLSGSLALVDPGSTTSSRVCALGHLASPGGLPGQVVACLAAGGSAATIFSASVADGVSILQSRASVPLTNPIGLFSMPVGSDLEIYAVDAHGNLTAVYGSTPPPSCKPAVGLGGCDQMIADDLMFVPACGSSSAKLLLHEQTTGLVPTAGKQVRQLDLTTGMLTTFGTVPKGADLVPTVVAFNNAGCLPDFDSTASGSTVEQVAVLDLTSTSAGTTVTASRAHFACPASGANCAILELAPGAGVGFATGAAPYMIITTVDATGVVLVSAVLVTQGATHSLVELDRSPSAAIPHILSTGQLDSDGSIDMFWDNDLGKRGTEFEVAYARTVNGQALSALSPTEFAVGSIMIGDINGDGFDDIAITNKTGTGLAVIPTRVVADTGALMTDSTCTP